MVENVFGHLKEELFNHSRFDTVEEFTTAPDEYLGCYSTTRISTMLRGLSPVEYRTQALTV